MMAARPLAITPGEPAGIGPDLLLTLASQAHPQGFVALADADLLTARAQALGLNITLEAWTPGNAAATAPGKLSFVPVPLAHAVTPGRPEPANAQAQLDALDRAVDGCLDGTYSGLVTGPMQKSAINDAGIPFSGHTEYLAARAGGQPVMMLVAGTLRVALATTHLPLRAVADAITPHGLRAVLTSLVQDLHSRFRIAAPRIAVLGLNPHAGEAGHLGREELDIIIPVLDALRAEGMDLVGPLPADTAFTPAALAGVDAVLAMYHDQGLPVLKHVGFGHAVNCTLGLPLIRTSVDHGTALSLAGSGRADPGSLQEAIDLAAYMAGNIL